MEVLLTPGPENRYHAIKPEGVDAILEQFSPEQQREIQQKLRVLSSLAYFIGKDFEMPVELNEPGQGWHWDFKANKVRVDSRDLLEKPMDYLRFVMCHEGGHRRISRVDNIPLEEWKQPGFSFMMNAIEDPRDNNFVAEVYPKFREQMKLAYQENLDFESKSKEKAQEKLGYQPRFMQAGFEYIKQWFRESQGQDIAVPEDLPSEVKEAVEKTIKAAQESWWRYPSRQEADESEDRIKKYAQASYEINRDQVWPEFKKLVDMDMEDQTIREFLKGQQSSEAGEGQGEGTKLTPADFDALSEEKKKELIEKATAALKEFADELADDLRGKLSEQPGEPKDQVPSEPESAPAETSDSLPGHAEEITREASQQFRKKLEGMFKEDKKDSYREALAAVAPMIDNLTGDLRDVFVKRKMSKATAGYRQGRRWNVRQRIREIIAEIPLIKTEAREQPPHPSEEKDYAIALMVDLSGSMRGAKAQEAFKSAVLLAETLNNLDIKFEVVGFQDVPLEFKSFGDELTDAIRDRMNGLPAEVMNVNPGGHNNAGDNDDGACLREVSGHLASQPSQNKFIIVLSDGAPAMDSGKKDAIRLDRELREAVRGITTNTSQKLVGVGILSKAVAKYYPNNIPNVSTQDLAETLGEVLREVIEKY